MPVLTVPAARPDWPASPAGPPKLSGAALRRAQAETLRTPRFRCSAPARLLFLIVDLVYGRQRAASYRLNAAFEDHAEHEYMLFVTEHPEWEAQPYDGSFRAGYGHHGSVADLFRQIGHDERAHKLESLAALDEPRLRDDLPAALGARRQRRGADHRPAPGQVPGEGGER